MTTITEADVEEAALAWLADLGWGVAHGPDIAPETPNAERDDYGQVVLEYRLRDALAELNPGPARRRPGRRLSQADAPGGVATLEARNGALSTGFSCTALRSSTRDAGGRLRGDNVRGAWISNVPACNDLARRQPVHRHREPQHAQAGRRPVRERPAPWRHRTEEPYRRGRHHLVGVAAAPDPTSPSCPRYSP